MEFVGRDWALVYRAATASPCLLCGAPTLLLVAFRPHRALPMCGACRGY